MDFPVPGFPSWALSVRPAPASAVEGLCRFGPPSAVSGGLLLLRGDVSLVLELSLSSSPVSVLSFWSPSLGWRHAGDPFPRPYGWGLLSAVSGALVGAGVPASCHAGLPEAVLSALPLEGDPFWHALSVMEG